MHLTNYSVNKYNTDYKISGSAGESERTGSKRSLKYLFEYLRTQHLDATALWKDIQVSSRESVVDTRTVCRLEGHCDQNCLPRSTTSLLCLSNVSSRCIADERKCLLRNPWLRYSSRSISEAVGSRGTRTLAPLTCPLHHRLLA